MSPSPGGLSRLSTFALGAAIAIAAETGANLVRGFKGGRPATVQPELVAMGAAILVSGTVALLVRTRVLPPRRLVDLGSAYIVTLTLLVSFGDHLEGWWVEGHGLHGIPWACLLIAVFPFVAPGSMRRNFTLAALLLVFDPLGLAAAAWVAGHPMPAIAAYADVVVPDLIAVFLAVGMSAFIDGLRRDVRKAQQLGQYTLEDKIGEGGMGVVFRARHAMLRRATALKLLQPDAVGEKNIARFEQEVQSTAQLTHPNTVQIYDYGRTPEGIFYYAMEFLDGITLEELVEQHGPLPPGRVIHILRQVCGALQEAHRAGLVHRDIKPANLMLCERGEVPDVAKVLDFGLVKSIREHEDASLTRDGVVTGTPQYMPPEALSDPEKVDARSDLYSLGAVGYFLVTGTHVFEGKTVVEICSHHLHTPAEPPSKRLGKTVPEDLESILLRCLAKSPEQRPGQARQLDEALAGCRDARVWSPRKATAWWDAHRESIRGRSAEATPLPLAQTLAVDWERRLPASGAPAPPAALP